MSTLVSAFGVASQAVAHDPRSDRAAEAIASMVQAIDEFLTTPPFTLLHHLEPDARMAALREIADRVRRLIEGIRNMLSVAAQFEQHGGPVSWAPPLADAIARLETEFRDIPDLARRTAPPIVRETQGPMEQWYVEEPLARSSAAAPSTPSEPSDESIDDILEDTMDLIRAQHTEAMARARNEEFLDFETVRRELNLDRD